MRKVLRKAFIPHKENDFRPHILRAKVIAPVIVILLVMQAIAWWGMSGAVPYSRLTAIIEANALTDGTNAARTAAGLPGLQPNGLLQAAAQEKANDMATNNYFAHTSPSGLTPWYWFVHVGYNFSYAGENLAVNFSDSQDVTNAWLASPEHRANILDTNYTQIGIATAQGTYNGQPATYVVELFGAPAAAVAPIAENIPSASASEQANSSPSKGRPGGVSSPTPVPAPIVAIAKIPTVIPAAAVAVATGTEPVAVAVKGASTESVQVAAGALASNQNPTPVAAPAPVAPQTNAVQRAFANPTQTLDNFYYLILAFFAFALLLNICIKIRVQHPDLILGGLVAISLAGIFIIVNQSAILQVVVR